MKQHASGIGRRVLARFGGMFFCLLLASCGDRGSGVASEVTVRIIDEAFAHILPVTASAIAKLPDGMGYQAEGKTSETEGGDAPFLPVASIEESTGKLVGRWARNDAVIPGIVIASPLAAKKIVSHAASLDSSVQATMPDFVVPFGKNSDDENHTFHAVAYDFSPAYAAMGKKAALLTKISSSRDGNDASCGILFQENFMRDAGALDAFIASYSDGFGSELGENHLAIDVLESEELRLDPVGATKAAVAALTAKKGISVVVLAIDDAAAAEAVAAMASADGSADIVFMADLSAWGDRKPAQGLFRYGIRGDEKGLARVAIGMAKDVIDGKKPDAARKVPLRFVRFFWRIF